MKDNSTASLVTIQEKVLQPNGELSVRSYIKGRLLGTGSSASCYELFRFPNNSKLASKIIPKAHLKPSDRHRLMNEISIHSVMRHPNIVSFDHFFQDSQNFYILLELCPNQSLKELVARRKRLTEVEVRCYAMQILSGLKYIHSQNIIHRDLKLANLFLSQKMQLKIGDFGLAVHASKLQETGACGTPNYMSPEMLEGHHSYKADVWAFGVVVYMLLVGAPPFESSDLKGTCRRIRMNAFNFPFKLSQSAEGLIVRILQSDPSKRPSLQEIEAHDFFRLACPQSLPISCLMFPPPPSFLKNLNMRGPETLESLPESAESAHYMQSLESLPKHVSPRQRRSQSLKGKPKRPLTRIDNVPAQQQLYDKLSVSRAQTHEGVFVQKWVDYSSKYGLGFLLSDMIFGVSFNDQSQMCLGLSSLSFKYITPQGGGFQERTLPLIDYRKDLHKKITLVQHFRSYLEVDGLDETQCESIEPRVYVKAWMKTKHATIFRLTSKVVQVYFNDRTEILLLTEARKVLYVNKKGESSEYPLATAMEDAYTEMTKRLKYAKDILKHILDKEKQGAFVING